LLTSEDVVFVANLRLLIIGYIEREVNVEAFARTLSDLSVCTSLPWVELPLVKSVDRQIEH